MGRHEARLACAPWRAAIASTWPRGSVGPTTRGSRRLVCDRCRTGFDRPYKSDPKAVRFCSHECRYADQLEQHRVNQTARSAYLKVWRKKNPHLLKAALVRRKARKAGVHVYEVSGRDLQRLVARFGGTCAYCQQEPYKHLDHVMPLARGGRHVIGNLLPSCSACNLSKGAKLLAEWRLIKPVPRRFRRRGRQSLAKAS